jgi:hypothetical protein
MAIHETEGCSIPAVKSLRFGAYRLGPRTLGLQVACWRAKAVLKSQGSIAPLVLLMALCSGFAQSGGASGPEIVAKHTVAMTQPLQHVPTGAVVDGPILGNGDLGIAMAGPP